MKISYNWLKLYLDINLSPDKVADLLTGCGLEVESMEIFQSVKGGLKGVVVGEVLTCKQHPDSDHLSITTVNIGLGEPLTIVCGASNVAAGQKVPVATTGTTLYFNDKPLTLQRTKIRGEISEGMICAEDELGLGTSHAGIMILDPEAPVGTPAAQYFNIEEDFVYTIGLTPNRTDATSHLGVARDLAAVINNSGRENRRSTDRITISLPDVSAFTVNNDNRHIDVIVENTTGCPRYTALTLSGIKVKESPGWLKNKLMAIGLRPINNVVDVTNFVLMELGQPLHAFDCNRITGDKVIVKNYPTDTKFITLDNIERELTEEDLMICNAVEPMVIAGVFGGVKSGVTNETTSIFLESAYFNPRHIRKTARHHGLQTDASFRFERGADYDVTEYALKRAALLIQDLAGGEISSEIVDVYPVPFLTQHINFSFKNLDRLIGKSIDRGVVKDILHDLGISVTSETETGSDLTLIVPAFKSDVTREVDIIEEILRVYGYNNIDIPDEIRSSISFTKKPDPEQIQNHISEFLSARGFHEIMNNSLTKSEYYEDNSGFQPALSVRIFNPISRDLDVMRQTLLHGALESIVYNQNRKQTDLKLYEFGTTYTLSNSGIVQGYHEEQHLSLVLTGRKDPENWNDAEEPVDFFVLKGFIEAIFRTLDLDIRQFSTETVHSDIFSNGLRYIDGKKEFLVMGSLSNVLLKSFDCKPPVFYAEVNWDHLLTIVPATITQYREIPRFPEVRRDLALLLDQSVTFAQIEKLAFQTEKKLLKHVGLFDVFEGDQIGEKNKSYALSFILQDDEKTLTDKEIEKTMARLIKVFVTTFNARIR
ncbi:MAG: phenylalanine--tRNA ligase subunit beta [Bacteroidales bacterium]|jgi:phenylalanyl-tRNA synthetase beta chain|nr:phenylalanine--tRNA ligase subunit beta [Bacteroidales bacterium]